MSKKVKAVYHCRNCGAVYKAGEYPAENLRICQGANGAYDGERIQADHLAAALYDIHTCDACVPRFGVGDLVGWE